ncbi:MAG: hypothetical protein ACTSRX_02260 [Promethearchaeota archaeon]
MQTIVCKQRRDIVGLIVIPENGEHLIKSELERLLPYVKYVIAQNINNTILDTIEITDSGYKILDADSETINIIINVCCKYLSEKIIVRQDMDYGPELRHRPLYFGKSKTDNSIVVKFTLLGDFNTLDSAFIVLDKLYTSDMVINS